MSVSVVICTRNRAGAIGRCLSSIEVAAQQVAGVNLEIVVVDNGSNDDTTAVVRAWSDQATIPVQIHQEPRPGIPFAKNRGLRAAKGDVLVLTDDDCRVRSDYVAELLRVVNGGPEALRGGRVVLGNPEDLPLTIKDDPIPRSWTIADRAARRENLGNCFLGCNLFMTRQVYERLGPFDERFGAGAIPSGEDTDYIFRAYSVGLLLEYSPTVCVYHDHGRKRPDQAKRLWQNYMIGSGALYAKYITTCPELCRQPWWDLKSAAQELLRRQNLFLPEYDFSYASKLRCYAIGARAFLSASPPPARQPGNDR